MTENNQTKPPFNIFSSKTRGSVSIYWVIILGFVAVIASWFTYSVLGDASAQIRAGSDEVGYTFAHNCEYELRISGINIQESDGDFTIRELRNGNNRFNLSQPINEESWKADINNNGIKNETITALNLHKGQPGRAGSEYKSSTPEKQGQSRKIIVKDAETATQAFSITEQERIADLIFYANTTDNCWGLGTEATITERGLYLREEPPVIEEPPPVEFPPGYPINPIPQPIAEDAAYKFSPSCVFETGVAGLVTLPDHPDTLDALKASTRSNSRYAVRELLPSGNASENATTLLESRYGGVDWNGDGTISDTSPFTRLRLFNNLFSSHHPEELSIHRAFTPNGLRKDGATAHIAFSINRDESLSNLIIYIGETTMRHGDFQCWGMGTYERLEARGLKAP